MGRIVKSEFGKNVLTLMTGSTIAQILPIAFTPILTRLFSPEEFGLFAFYLSIVTFLLVISAGRYEQAIVLPKEDENAINIFALSFVILIVYTMVISVGLFFFTEFFLEKLNKPELNDWIWLIPFCVFFASSYKIFTYWSNRKKRFGRTSLAVMSQTSSRVSVQLIGGFKKNVLLINEYGFIDFFRHIFDKAYVFPKGITTLGIGSFVLSYLIGFFIGTVVFLMSFLKHDFKLLKLVSKERILKQAKVYEKFPKINSLHAMGDEFKNLGVNSVIIYSFSDVLLGFYSMTFRILRAPLSVIGNSFAQVFYQKAAEMHSNGQNFVPLINATVKKLSLIALPIFISILLVGPFMFGFVLGEKWRVAGEYAQYLTPWLFLNFSIAPIQQIAVILNKQGKIFFLSIVGNLLIFGSILIGGYFEDIKIGFTILSILQVFYYLYIYLWIKSIAKKNWESTRKND